MKKFFKFGCLGAIALVVLLIIIGVMVGGGDEDNKSSEPAKKEPASTETPKKEKPAKKEEVVTTIGQELVVGKAAFKVNEITNADQVGPSVLPAKASEKFVVVNVTYKNNGNEAVTIDSSFFKLKQGEKTFEADTSASMSANQSDDGNIDNSFFLQQVNPDSTITGNVVFDVNETVATAGDLKLQVQTGIFGTETGLIELK